MTPSTDSRTSAGRRRQSFITRLLWGSWLDTHYPELRLARTEFERTEAAARAKNQRLPSWRELASIAAFVVCILALVIALPRVRPYWMPDWLMLPIIMGSSLLFARIMMAISRGEMRRRIREYLRSRGIPICLSCGYDLSGIEAAAPRCPECGSALTPRAEADPASSARRETPAPPREGPAASRD